LAHTTHGSGQARRLAQPPTQRGQRFNLWVLFTVLATAVLAVGCGSSAPKVAVTIPTLRSTNTPAAEGGTLKCQAWASSSRPHDNATVKIQVRTVANAWVSATHALALVNGESIAGRASSKGEWTVRFQVRDATPGARVVITVHVSRQGSRGTCQASFRPQSASPISVAVPTRSATPPSSAPSPPQATAASCYPLSNEGTCYEPGEFCRNSDHGASGVAGDGESIICEYNDGWRWEPV
jgi:hypothetical protein